jgi:hypothetical protein
VTRKTPFEVFLGGRDPQTAGLARRLRTLLRRNLPGAIETSDKENWGIGRGTGYRDTLFVISPQKGNVNLGFHDGAALPDPDELLEGAGKRHRHLKVRTQSQLQDARVIRLIQAAVRRPVLEGRARSTAARPPKEET